MQRFIVTWFMAYSLRLNDGLSVVRRAGGETPLQSRAIYYHHSRPQTTRIRRRAGLTVPLCGTRRSARHANTLFIALTRGEIATDIVIATPLTDKQPKTPPRIALARPGAAQVDHSSHILLLLECSGRDAPALQRARYAAIQVRGSELDGVSRHDPG